MPKKDHRARFDVKKHVEKPLGEHMRDVLATATANHRTPRRWEINQPALELLTKDREDLGRAGAVTSMLGVPVDLVHDDKIGPTFKLIVDPRHG